MHVVNMFVATSSNETRRDTYHKTLLICLSEWNKRRNIQAFKYMIFYALNFFSFVLQFIFIVPFAFIQLVFNCLDVMFLHLCKFVVYRYTRKRSWDFMDILILFIDIGNWRIFRFFTYNNNSTHTKKTKKKVNKLV